ncbi:MAG: sulfite exporter TauE/SafE family protein [Actinomycetota bacterium]|nr:sulfite exporter TauE/SafE family protein [Actinomycetota bacterium]
MDYLQLLLLGLIGIAGGILSGLVGVGGGIVFVPGLVYAGGWEIKEAVAASLVIIVFSALSGTLRNARSEDPVNWRVAGLLSLTVAPSSLIGVFISRVSPEIVVKVAFAVLLLALAYPTARGRGEYDADRKDIPLPLVFVAGIFIGSLSGLVGVGGGVMMVPLMVLGMGLTTKGAVSTSLAVVMFTGVIGAAGYVATGFRDPQDLLSLPPLIVGSMVGAPLGVRLRDRLPSGVIRVIFGAFMVIVALRLFGEAFGVF